MKYLQILFLFVCLCFSLNAIVAQQRAPIEKQSDEPQADEREKAVQEKAFEMLEQTVKSASLLKLTENRAFVYAAAGDLWWKRDEKRAREMFARAAAEIGANVSQTIEPGFDLTENFWRIQNLRHSLVQIVAEHDAEMALEILRQTRLPIFDQVLNLPAAKIPLYQNFHAQAQNELQMEQNLAAKIVRKNPRRALELARANLAKNVSFSDLNLIEELNKTDADNAAKFADEVLQKILATNLSGRDNYNIRNLTANFLSRFGAPPNAAANPAADKAIRVNAAALRQLAVRYSDYFLSNNFQAHNYYEISAAMPTLEKILPERVERLRRKAETLKQHPESSDSQYYEKLHQMSASAAPNEMLEEVENFPTGMRWQVYNTAAGKLGKAGEYQRARQILLSLPAGQNRDAALFQLDWTIFSNYLNNAKFAEAEQIIAQQTDRSYKIKFLIEVANYSHNAKQKEKAEKVLSEAFSLVNANPENHRELGDFAQVLNACAAIEPEKAFALIEAFVPKANELFAASALLSKYQPQVSNLRDDEFIIASRNFFSAFGGLTLGLDLNSFSYLAKADLERALDLSNRFDRSDIRTAAQLMILRGVLSRKNLNQRNFQIYF